jgi:hypothetical protein
VMLRMKTPEVGSHWVHKVLLTPEKEVEDTAQRTRLFRTTCKTKGWKCKVIVDSGSTDNLVSTEMVEKLELETTITRVHTKYHGCRKDIR